MSALGKNFAIFRGNASMEAFIVDAYCPHLGANLAAGGGRVAGDCIQCPFHGWTFDGHTGRCLHVPYAVEVTLLCRLVSKLPKNPIVVNTE